MKYTLILFTTFLSFEFCFGQIVKITSPNPDEGKVFAFDVRISNNDALIDEANLELGVEGLIYSYIYQQNNGQWNNTQTIPFDNIKQYFDYPEISYNKILIPKLSPESLQTDTIEVYEKESGIYHKKAFIKVPSTYHAIHFANFNDWIVIRSFKKKLENNNYIYFIRTDFYNKSGENWILIDSFIDTPKLYSYIGSIYHSAMSDKFVIIGNSANSDKIKYSGKIDIYKLKSNHWHLNQEIYAPDTTIIKFGLGEYISLSPDNRFFAATSINRGIYIYQLIGDKFEFFQNISVNGYNTSINNLVISGDKLFFASPRDDRYSINYYKLKGDKFEFQCKIHPPGKYDTNQAIFRSYTLSYSDETLLVGDPSDVSQDTVEGAAYFINIPALGSMIDTICNNETYQFGGRILDESGIYFDTLVSSYCVDSIVKLNLTVIPNQNTTIDTVLCDGQSITIDSMEISEPGDYNFESQNSNGCQSILNIHLEYSEIDTNSIILSDLGCKSGAIDFKINGNNPPYNYKWNTGSSSNNLSSITDGKYNLEVKDKSGCVYNYDFEVPDSIPYLIPNAFFPGDNKDSINKEFRIYLADQSKENPRVKIISTKVFDRWGNKVFESEGNNFWDGTKHGTPLPPQVYLYSISIETPCGIDVKTGQIMLMR